MLLVDELREVWREEPRQHALALAVILVIAVALRLLYVAQPMRSEEAIAYMSFVREPLRPGALLAPDPNNHVLYTWLAKLAAGAFGPAPWAMRLPALIAGILIVPATYAVARAIYGGRAAIIATGFAASSGALVLYSTNARGYSLVALCFLLLVLVAIRLLRGSSGMRWAAFAVVAAVGLATMPAMLFALGTVAIWLTLSAYADARERDDRRLAMLAVVAVLTLMYTPSLARGGGGALQQAAAPGSDWLAFFIELPMTIGSMGLSWSLGLPPIVAIAFLFFVVVAVRRHAALSRFRIGLPLAAFVFCSWLLVVTHRAPLPRVWLWLLPLFLSLTAAGLIAVLEQRSAPRRLVTDHVGLFAMGIAVLGAVFVTRSSAVLVSLETGLFRDAERATDALKVALRPGDLVVTGPEAAGVLSYYFEQKKVDRSHLAVVPSRAQRVFVVVDSASGQALDRMPVPREVRDTMRFAPPAVAVTLPSSRIYLFERRNAGRP